MTNAVNSGINFSDYAIKLSRGDHATPQEGMCIMECVAYLNGEEHTDHPQCADPGCTSYAIILNDNSTSIQRNRLLPFVMRLAGSRNEEHADTRMFMMLDYGARKMFPYLARQSNFVAQAISAESIPEIKDHASMKFAMQKLSDIMNSVPVSKADQDMFSMRIATTTYTAAQSLVRVMVLAESALSKSQLDDYKTNTYQAVARAVFYVQGMRPTHGIPPKEFDLHVDLLDRLLSLTDEKQDEDAPTKLKELVEITKDHELNVTFA